MPGRRPAAGKTYPGQVLVFIDDVEELDLGPAKSHERGCSGKMSVVSSWGSGTNKERRDTLDPKRRRQPNSRWTGRRTLTSVHSTYDHLIDMPLPHDGGVLVQSMENARRGAVRDVLG